MDRMPRAIWTGAISFGLVNIPVKLYPAVSRKTVHFNQIDTRSQSRIRMKRVSAADGSDVPNDVLAKGYELADGSYVIVTDEELAALDPEASRTVDIEQFAALDQIDPIFYDAPYNVAPDQAAVKPYALLLRAMEESGRVAIARFVMRTKEYLCAVRPDEGRLVLSTMVYADEVNDPAEVSELSSVGDVDISERELTMARQLIDSLDAAFKPDEYHDTYREKVLELIEAKASGATEVLEAPPAEAEGQKVVDLMAALEQSVKDAKASRSRHPTARKAQGAKKASKAAKKKAAS